MKKLKVYLFLAVMAFAFTAVISGCKEKDPCEDISCQNGGTCNSGNCACTFSYEGKFCDTLKRDKFLGTYVGQITVGSFPASDATIAVTPAGSSDSMSVLNMSISNVLINGSIKGIATGGNNLVIPAQSISSYNITGTGRLDGNVMYDTIVVDGIGSAYFQGVRQ